MMARKVSLSSAQVKLLFTASAPIVSFHYDETLLQTVRAHHVRSLSIDALVNVPD